MVHPGHDQKPTPDSRTGIGALRWDKFFGRLSLASWVVVGLVIFLLTEPHLPLAEQASDNKLGNIAAISGILTGALRQLFKRDAPNKLGDGK